VSLVHVVWLTHNYPRHPGDLSGSFLHPLAAALVRRDIRVTVLAPSDAGHGGEETRDGVRIRRLRYASPARERYAYTGTMLNALRSPAGGWALVGLIAALRRGAREEHPRLVHAHWWTPAGVAAPPEIPRIVTLHGTDARLLERWPLRPLARRVLRRSRLVTTVSEPLAQQVERLGRLPRPPVVQPMPVDTTGWAWSEGGGGAVTVARLTAQKRVHLALQAAAALRDRGRPVPLTVVGDGPLRAELEARTTGLGLNGLVRFTGALAAEEVRAVLVRADVFVLPAHQEGFGLAAAEALMLGVPVVACHDAGGLLDLVPPAGAGRVAAPEGKALANAIAGALEDAGARPAAREAGAVWRARLAPDHVAAQVAGWYAEAARD
jgi:glycosyltransferase involved in cell wall biosynthesis